MKISKKIEKEFIKSLREVGNYLLKTRKNFINKGNWKEGQYFNKSDRVIDYFLKAKLKNIYDIDIQSEEKVIKINKIKNFYWLIDPIDGTASYANGYDGFVTQVALIKNNKPILAGVFAPKKNYMFHAIKNKGAYFNNKKIVTKKIKAIENIIDNFKKPYGVTLKIFNKFNCKKYIESGSLGLKCCLVASNKAAIFVKNVIIRIWDIAPAYLIISEAGGTIKDLHGRNICFKKNLLINGLVVSQSKYQNSKILNFLKKNKIKPIKYLSFLK
jgi:3'-phosphoadenosine 5'-phosphosulfate (PAPS) 3'-phosphatase